MTEHLEPALTLPPRETTEVTIKVVPLLDEESQRNFENAVVDSLMPPVTGAVDENRRVLGSSGTTSPRLSSVDSLIPPGASLVDSSSSYPASNEEDDRDQTVPTSPRNFEPFLPASPPSPLRDATSPVRPSTPPSLSTSGPHLDFKDISDVDIAISKCGHIITPSMVAQFNESNEDSKATPFPAIF